MAEIDDQAMQWAKSNPNDPRAGAVLAKASQATAPAPTSTGMGDLIKEAGATAAWSALPIPGITDPRVRQAIANQTVGPGVIDQMYSAKTAIQDAVQKYPPSMNDTAMDTAVKGYMIQDDLNKKLQGIPDVGPGDPKVAQYYNQRGDSLVPDIKATAQATWDFMGQKHGALQQIANPMLIPEQFAVREAITGLTALGKMPHDDAKQLLSQNQLFWSDLLNYYWKDPSDLAQRGTRLMLGMGANIAFDPASAITGIGKLTEETKQVQLFDQKLNLSKASPAEIAQAKVASRVSEIIQNPTFGPGEGPSSYVGTHLQNKQIVQDFGQGKIGFDDMTKSLDLPQPMMDDVKIAGQGMGQQPTYLEGLADRSRAPHFGVKIPFTNVYKEFSPGFATDITQVAGKGALAAMSLVSNVNQYLGDNLTGFIGKVYTGMQTGVQETMNALRQMKTKTGVAPWDATVNWYRGYSNETDQTANKMAVKANQLVSGATPEEHASIINVLESENKDVSSVISEFPNANQQLLETKLNQGNEQAQKLRQSFPPEKSDQLNQYIDMHQNVTEQALAAQQAQGLPVQRLDPMRTATSPTAYVAHVVTQKLKDFRTWTRETIGLSDAAQDARMGKTIDRSTYGREDTRSISDANAETQEALGVPKFVNHAPELMLHTYVNSRQSIAKNILLKSALDTAVHYTSSDIGEAARLELQFKQQSELAGAGDEQALQNISQIEPRLQQLKQKMSVPDGWVKNNPDHWTEMVDVLDDQGKVVTNPSTGKAQVEPKAHMFVPQEFVQDGHHIWFDPLVYNQAKEIANPIRGMSTAELLLDKAGTINNALRSVYVSRPGTAGTIALSKMSEFLINGANYPIKSAMVAIQYMEPPAPVQSVISKFGTFQKALEDEKPIMTLPDGTTFSKQEFSDMLTKYNVTGNSMAQPVPWEGVMDQLHSSRTYNQEMGTVPKTALEFATLFRTSRYMVQTTDDFFKTMTFADKLMSGFTPQAAAEAVERQYFNFNNVNRFGANSVLKPLTMFTAHPIKALESAVWKFAQGPLAQLSIPWKVNHTLQGAYIQDPMEREALSQQLPMMDQLKEPVLGSFMPGGREIMLDPSYSNQTLSMFLDPEKNLSPVVSLIGAGLMGHSRTRFDGDVEESEYMQELKQQIAQSLPWPIQQVLRGAEASGLIDTSKIAGRGGLFGQVEKPPVTDSEAAQMHYADSLQFGKHIQDLMKGTPYELFFRPLDGDTLKEQEEIIARGNMMAASFRDTTLGQAYIRNMDNSTHQVDARLEKNGEELKQKLIESYRDRKADEDQALKDHWQDLCNNTAKLTSTDRSFIMNMCALNRNYANLGEQYKQEIASKGLMPDATAINDWERLQQIAVSNPIAAQMVATKQQQVALHSFYSWILATNREAEEKTGVPGFNPFKQIFGLENTDFSPEARNSLQQLKEGAGSFLDKNTNQQNQLQRINSETLH